MLKNFEEIFDLLDPDSKLFLQTERESLQITRKLEEFSEYLQNFTENSVIKQAVFLESEFYNKIYLGKSFDSCELCLLPVDLENITEVKGKKGHVVCLNYWLNRVLSR